MLQGNRGGHRETLQVLLHPCQPLLIPLRQHLCASGMEARGDKQHGIGTQLNTCGEVAGQGLRPVIQRQRRAGGSLDLWEGDYTYRCILTNDYESSEKEIVEFYNKRGGKERYFDEMNNGFGWNRLPKSFLKEDTVFILITALIRNFYKTLIARMPVEKFGLKKQAVSRPLPSGSYPYRPNGFGPQGCISSIYTPTTAPIERFSGRDPDNADCLLAQTAYCLKSLRGVRGFYMHILAIHTQNMETYISLPSTNECLLHCRTVADLRKKKWFAN